MTDLSKSTKNNAISNAQIYLANLGRREASLQIVLTTNGSVGFFNLPAPSELVTSLSVSANSVR